MSSYDYPELRLPLWVRLILAACAGLLLTASYALHPLCWAPWLAPALLIPAAAGAGWRAWLVGAAAGAVSTVSVITYYLDFSLMTAVVVFLLRMVAWGGAAALASRAWRRLPPVLAMLVLPAFVAALEAVALTVSVHGAAGSLAYSQMALLPIIQAAAWGGVPAVVFLVLLPGGLVGGLVMWRPMWRPALLAGAGAAVVLGAAGLHAALRLETPLPAHRLSVAMVASDRLRGIPEDWDKVWSVYGPAAEHAAQPGRLVVLPEKIALLDAAKAARAADEVRALAVARQATVVVGIEVHTGIYRNRALVARPDGSLAWYDKQRLVPVFEDRDVPGSRPLIFQMEGVTAGAAICKDMHIPSIGGEYAGQVDVMAVPAWDFGQDGWMGARMTLMRGIENGYAIVRSARNGLVGAYDAYGRVIAEAPSGDRPTVVTALLPAARVDTPYTHIRDAFGWLCALFSVAVMVGLRFRRPNEKGGE